MFSNLIFKDPWILFLIPAVLAAYFFYVRKQKDPSFLYPSMSLAASLERTWKTSAMKVLKLARWGALLLFLVALAGPRLVEEETIINTEGIDIVLAIDASGSMAAEDFTIDKKRFNRLHIVKDVVRDFIDQRKNDRIGLVAFAGLAYTICPLTTDYSWLKKNLDRVDLGLIEDGTAIGSAITASLARLRNSDAKSKIIILLTDGVNNAGKVDPIEAARAAEAFGIRVYTIGAGTKGFAPFPARDIFSGRKIYQRMRVDIDEKTLREVAKVTNAEYFRATDTKSLQDVYTQIDEMEKTEIEEIGYFEYTELFDRVLLLGMLLLVLESVLSNTILLRIP